MFCNQLNCVRPKKNKTKERRKKIKRKKPITKFSDERIQQKFTDIAINKKKRINLGNFKCGHTSNNPPFIYFGQTDKFGEFKEFEKYGLKIHFTFATNQDLKKMIKHGLPCFAKLGIIGKIIKESYFEKYHSKNSKYKYQNTAHKSKDLILYLRHVFLRILEEQDEQFAKKLIQQTLQYIQTNIIEEHKINAGFIPITSALRIRDNTDEPDYCTESDICEYIEDTLGKDSKSGKHFVPDEPITPHMWFRDDSYGEVYIPKNLLPKMLYEKVELSLKDTQNCTTKLKEFAIKALKSYSNSRIQPIIHCKLLEKKRNTDIFITYDPRKEKIFIVHSKTNVKCNSIIQKAIVKIKFSIPKFTKTLHLQHKIGIVRIAYDDANRNQTSPSLTNLPILYSKSQQTETNTFITYSTKDLNKEDYNKIHNLIENIFTNQNNHKPFHSKEFKKFLHCIAKYNADSRKKLSKILKEVKIKYDANYKNRCRKEKYTILCKVDKKFKITGYTTEEEILAKFKQHNIISTKMPKIKKKETKTKKIII
jgi:hypothetical protein